MINFIYGQHGSGKTAKILDMIYEDTQKGIHTFLIVPDQETVQIERLLLAAKNQPSPLHLEVLSFSRLYNRVCREYGGLSYSYITDPMRYLLMWKTLRDLRHLLYTIDCKKEMALEDTLISTINELKSNGISADDLENVANTDEIKALSPTLAKKLLDISAIYSCFNDSIYEKYSDSADDLSRLCDVLDKKNFFKNTNVYIDSFTSFTSVQHKVIERIFKSALNVTITIPAKKGELDSIDTKSIHKSEKRLVDLAKEFCEPSVIDLSKEAIGDNDPLSFLAENLWKLDVSSSEEGYDPASSIVLLSCDTPYAEAEAVCVHIRKLLSEGERCKDIVIIARDAENYRGIIDHALTKSNIPFYFSDSIDILSTAAVKFIISALKIKLYNWQKKDVISHVKTGLCDISSVDGNLFEEYVNTWDIRGAQFLEDSWDMNPDGLVQTMSPRGKEILSAANRVRTSIVPTLEKFFILFDAAKNVDEMCRAVYTFLLDANLEEKLNNAVSRASARKDLKAMQENSRIFEIILNSLADIGTALSGETATTEEFITILSSVFKKTKINTIPTSIDEVTVGSANTLRTSNPKYAFVLGLCESKFPATVKDSGFFSYTDKNILFGSGISFDSNPDTRSSDELMFVKRSFSAPTERLYALTHKAEINGDKRFESLAFLRIQALFNIKIHNFSMSDFNYAIPAPKNAALCLNSIKDQKQKNALIKALSPYVEGIANYSSKEIKTKDCSLEHKISVRLDENKNNIYTKDSNDTLQLSPTAFESYAKCPFNYYCQSILNLRQQKKADFGFDKVGTFIHKILEDVIKYVFDEKTSRDDLTDEQIIEYVENSTKNYLDSICPTRVLISERLTHLHNRLKKLAFLLIKNIIDEFSDSDFTPKFFELKINGKGHNPEPLNIELYDGTTVTLSGTIDRVDVFKKDSDIYVKIIDYKTGSKEFALKDLQSGTNMQMLLYLYTICKNSSKAFKEAIFDEGGENIKPAGIVYLSTNVTPITTNNYQDEALTNKEIQDQFNRSGLLLSDESILNAASRSFDSKFLLGTTKTKKGALSGKSLVSETHFEEIYNELKSVITRISTDLHNGVINAKPLISKYSPCEYCPSKPICRNVQK